MTIQEEIKKYQDWIFRQSAYQMALNIIGIDKQTVAPSAGASYRDQRTAYLSGELFSIETEEDMIPVLKDLSENADDPDIKKGAELYYKEVMKTKVIPKDEYVASEELLNASYDAWLKAKKENDYSIFEPYLKKVIDLKKKEYGYRHSDKKLYDQMLDDFEPGMNMQKYDAFFEALKERLIPFIQKVNKARQIDDAFLYQEYDIDGQKKFMDHLLQYLHFDPSWGYQNETEHPFTDWTCENDCRTTTKYLKNNVISAILSTVHECGHAWYEHDVKPAYDGMILSYGISSGMHESQSRLCENYLGRSLPFWKYNYPFLQKQFPDQLDNVSLEQFVKAINVARPSLVRTEADELTYPMHIVIRYEIEKGLFNGSISTEGLDKTWNDMYQKYLGISSKDARDGILQDVHWSDGEFGYFPTYALGSAFAAQFVHKMREEIPVDDLLENNLYEKIMAWLKEHIHQYGCFYNADEIMLKATGEPFNVNYYLDYLEDKYTKLYNL
ncbi:MAG: carboxypeptidase M32 [Erysipelotrichaceae bacterium]|nr:carboxypeptidase M32 [Erysipelotrichaceae bacterium]